MEVADTTKQCVLLEPRVKVGVDLSTIFNLRNRHRLKGLKGSSLLKSLKSAGFTKAEGGGTNAQ